MIDSFPGLLARTQSFRLGRPQRCTLAPDGGAVLFLRGRHGEDRVRCLWRLDLTTGAEHPLVDPATVDTGGAEPSDQERVRRERSRDRGTGITDYSIDRRGTVVAWMSAGAVHLADPQSGQVTTLPTRTPLTDARISPDGTAVAYVSGGSLRLIEADGSGDRALAEPEGPDVTYGLAEHVAAESMDRHRGHWWSPGGDRLAVARVDNGPVQTWYLTDPSRPEAPPIVQAYPSAGTANAAVSLHILGRDGTRVDVDWDTTAFEYLVQVVWDEHGLLAVVQNRAQTVLRILDVNPVTGRSTSLVETTDPAWTTIVAGVPARLPDGSLVWTVDAGDTRHLSVAGKPVTPAGLQVAEVLGVDGDTVLFAASAEPTERHLWTWSADAGLARLTTEAGRHTGQHAGGTTLISSSSLSGHGVTVHRRDLPVRTVVDLSLGSPIEPRVRFVRAGEHEIRTAVLFPTGWRPGRRLPVLMDPYGGPAAQRAVADRDAYWVSQWFADQGFAVVVADGRGTPGRGPAWERTVHLDRGGPLLDDQIDALHAVAALHPDLDLGRVAIRGWSAGGYLAALAVLRRPDVFHAAVAGAPVTDHLLYDTHWQERFFGDPRTDPDPYVKASLIADAAGLERPLMLIHGLLDDNVYPVHTLRLSAALLAAGRPHTVLPLPGASHMPPDVDLLTPQLRFLQAALAGVDTGH